MLLLYSNCANVFILTFTNKMALSKNVLLHASSPYVTTCEINNLVISSMYFVFFVNAFLLKKNKQTNYLLKGKITLILTWTQSGWILNFLCLITL